MHDPSTEGDGQQDGSPVRIALVVPGGVDRSLEYRVIPALLALIARLAREHDVQVFALRQEPRAARWRMLGAGIANIGWPGAVPRGVLAIRREHARRPFDLVHCIWGGDPAFAGVTAAMSLGLPALVHLAGGELVAIRDIGYGGRLGKMRSLLDAWTLRRARCVTAASKPIIEGAETLGIVARRVPLGVDLAVWPALAPRRREAGGMARLIHVASLNRVKDQATLLKALQILAASGREFRADIVGEDVLGGEIQDLARRMGLDGRVTFHGFLTQRQLRPLIEVAHAHLVSSRHEAGPLSLLEAAVAGVPTVGTAVGHLREWGPQAASTVPVQDAPRFAAAIGELLDDEELRLSKARAAQRIACREDADHSARAFLDLYAEVLRA